MLVDLHSGYRRALWAEDIKDMVLKGKTVLSVNLKENQQETLPRGLNHSSFSPET